MTYDNTIDKEITATGTLGTVCLNDIESYIVVHTAERSDDPNDGSYGDAPEVKATFSEHNELHREAVGRGLGKRVRINGKIVDVDENDDTGAPRAVIRLDLISILTGEKE